MILDITFIKSKYILQKHTTFSSVPLFNTCTSDCAFSQQRSDLSDVKKGVLIKDLTKTIVTFHL